MTILESYISLPSMRFYAYHGVIPQERIVGAEYLVDLQVKTDFTQALLKDDLDGTINYALIHEIVKEEMEIPSKLLEHVAGRISKHQLEAFPAIEQIKLGISKQNPPMGADNTCAGVSITVTR